jgi:hypothetical protein
MTERHTIFTKASQIRESDASTVSREGGGSVHPTLGGGYVVSPDVVRSGTAFEGVVR